jgi:quercetin dioxygenase-like cupin family protein
VYVIEGTYELGIDDQPTKTYKTGESFQEPSGALHRVSRNASASEKARLIAFLVHPRGVKDLVTPAEH